MKGNWDRGTNSSLTSKRSNKLILAFVMVVTFLTAMAAPAAAAGTYYPEEVEEWGEVEMTPYLLFSGTSAGGLFVLQYGDQVLRDDIEYDAGTYSGGGIVIGSKQELLADHTYHIRLAYSGTANSDNTPYNSVYGFSITESFPLFLSEVAPSPSNSINKSYLDLIKTNGVSNQSIFVRDIYFSTADGYIDNSPLGEVYINIHLNNLDYDIQKIQITSLSGYCKYDPDASYYTNIWGDKLDQTADEFMDLTGQLGEKQSEISGMANDLRSGVIDQFTGMLSTTAGFVSPAATFASGDSVSIYGAANVFLGLYNSILGALPPTVQALFTVIPMLAFLAWLFGFGRSL